MRLSVVIILRMTMMHWVRGISWVLRRVVLLRCYRWMCWMVRRDRLRWGRLKFSDMGLYDLIFPFLASQIT